MGAEPCGKRPKNRRFNKCFGFDFFKLSVRWRERAWRSALKQMFMQQNSGFGNEYEYRAMFMIIPPLQDLFTLIIARQKPNHSQTFPIHQTRPFQPLHFLLPFLSCQFKKKNPSRPTKISSDVKSPLERGPHINHPPRLSQNRAVLGGKRRKMKRNISCCIYIFG